MNGRALAALALAACGPGTGGRVALEEPDPARFAGETAAILSARCGTSSCHGRAERPFALFAVGQRRLPPTTTFARTPLSEVEIAADYAATLGFLDAARALDTTLVQNALGRAGHGGGAVFEHRSDPECRALRGWIDGGED